MRPGLYLEKRRLMAGYSLTSLARELLLLTGFGTARAESDFRQLRCALIAAEHDVTPHSRARIEAIRCFVPLDPEVYFRLLADEHGVPGLCPLCACSLRDPCLLAAAPAAPLGAGVCQPTAGALCSACATLAARSAPAAAPRAAAIRFIPSPGDPA